MLRFTIPGCICLLCGTLLFAVERLAQASIYAAYKFSEGGDGHRFTHQLLGYQPLPYAFLVVGAVLIACSLFLPDPNRSALPRG